MTRRALQTQVAATSFLALFSIVGLALYGLPLYYDFMVREFGWSRTQVTSGNALSKLVIGPLFGFLAGWIIDRFGPRRLMLAGILLAGARARRPGRRCRRCGCSTPSTCSTRWATCAAARCPTRSCCRSGSRRAAARRWASPTSASASAARSCRGCRTGWCSGGAGAARCAAWACSSSSWRADGVLHEGGGATRHQRKEAREGRQRRRGAAPRGVPAGRRSTCSRFGSMCSIAAVGGANQHLKLFLSLDQGYTQAEAARFISLVLAFSIAGRLLMGWLADRMPKKRVMLLIYLLVAAAIPLLFFASSARRDVPVRGAVRPRPRRRVPDHPADGGRAVRRAACSAG